MAAVISAFLSLALAAAVCAVTNPRFQSIWQEWFEEKSCWLWQLSFVFTGYCVLATFMSRGLGEPSLFAKIAAYFTIPTALLYFSQRTRGLKTEVLEVGAISVLVFAAMFRWIPAYQKSAVGIVLPEILWCAAIYAIIVFLGRKKIEFHSPWLISLNDFRAIGLNLCLLFISIVPLATKIHFIKPGLGFFRQIPSWLLALLPPWTLLLATAIGYIFILLTISLPEEILFRGIFQGLLCKKMGGVPAVVLTAFVFGISHITRVIKTTERSFGFPNWWYVFFATITGLVYGGLYYRRKSLIAAVVLHATVDFIWILFFVN